MGRVEQKYVVTNAPIKGFIHRDQQKLAGISSYTRPHDRELASYHPGWINGVTGVVSSVLFLEYLPALVHEFIQPLTDVGFDGKNDTGFGTENEVDHDGILEHVRGCFNIPHRGVSCSSFEERSIGFLREPQ